MMQVRSSCFLPRGRPIAGLCDVKKRPNALKTAGALVYPMLEVSGPSGGRGSIASQPGHRKCCMRKGG
jgi:hypothetical protein